jgi:hypothetical protein
MSAYSAHAYIVQNSTGIPFCYLDYSKKSYPHKGALKIVSLKREKVINLNFFEVSPAVTNLKSHAWAPLY